MPRHGEIIGSPNPTDRMLGILIERTDALGEDTKLLRSITDDLRETHAKLGVLLDNLVTRLQEDRERGADVETRLRACEDELSFCANGVSDWRERKAELAQLAERLRKMDTRLDDAERGVSDWRNVKRKFITYALIIAALALTAGTAGGGFIRSALGIH